MSTLTKLSRVYNSSERVLFDENSRIILFSDVHRGDNSKADNFAFNKDIYISALDYYFENGYTYIEIGDGDELWENDRFSVLLEAHTDVYRLLNRFYNTNRFYMLWGNHDMVKKRRKFMFRNVRRYTRTVNRRDDRLFEGIKIHEGIVLQQRSTNNEILVVHGHQGDLLNDYLWFVARFLVRYLWRRFEYLKNRNPISPATNAARSLDVENDMKNWVRIHRVPLIAGHTHKMYFPWPGDVPYFNDGCCVKKDYITGIEITNNEIMLVKWSRDQDRDGQTGSYRQIMAGPEKLDNYFVK
jgi:UDP-2,3-diacylglucosamine pyrophosphatase LpxH